MHAPGAVIEPKPGAANPRDDEGDPAPDPAHHPLVIQALEAFNAEIKRVYPKN